MGATKLASQVELLSLNKSATFATLYLPKEVECSVDGESEDDGDSKERIGMVFQRSFEKVMWHSSNLTTAVCTSSNEHVDKEDGLKYTRSNYSVDTSYRVMTQTRISIPFPEVSVKKEFEKSIQIAWSPELAANSCRKASFQVGDVSLDTIESSWIDDYYTWGSDPSLQGVIDRSLCNTKEMTEWTNHIPTNTASFALPFFFSYSLASSFPLYLLLADQKCGIVIDHYENSTNALLRMRATNDGRDWVDVKFKSNWVDVGPQGTPQIRTDWSFCPPAFIDTEKVKDKIVIPIHSVVQILESNSTSGGRRSEIPITSDDPIVALFWKARDEDQYVLNNRSCYTTPGGKSSISRSRFYYDKILRFEYEDIDMTSIPMSHHFPNVSKKNGYFAHAFAQEPFDPRKLVGVPLEGELKAVLKSDIRGCEKREVVEVSDEVESDSVSDLVGAAINNTVSSSRIKEEAQAGPHSYKTLVNALVHRDLIFEKTIVNGNIGFSVTVTSGL